MRYLQVKYDIRCRFGGFAAVSTCPLAVSPLKHNFSFSFCNKCALEILLNVGTERSEERRVG